MAQLFMITEPVDRPTFLTSGALIVVCFLLLLFISLVPRNFLLSALLQKISTSFLIEKNPTFSLSCELLDDNLESSLSLMVNFPQERAAIILGGHAGGRALSILAEELLLDSSEDLCVAVLVLQPTFVPVNFYNASSGENKPGLLPTDTFVRAFLDLNISPTSAPPDSFIAYLSFFVPPFQYPLKLTLKSPMDGYVAPIGKFITLYTGKVAAEDIIRVIPVGGSATIVCFLLFRAYVWQLMGVPGGYPLIDDSLEANIFTRPLFLPQLIHGPRLLLRAAKHVSDPPTLRPCSSALEGSTGFWTPDNAVGRVGPAADGFFWQPSACSLRTFTAQSATNCLGRYKVITFAGDSLIRRLYKTFKGYTPGSWAAPEATASGWCHDRRDHFNCVCEDFNEDRSGFDSHLAMLGNPSSSFILLRFHFGLLSGDKAFQEKEGLLRAPFNNWAHWLESMAAEREGNQGQLPSIALVFDFVHWDLNDAALTLSLFLEEVKALASLLDRLVARGGVTLIWYKPIWPVRGETSHNASHWLSLGTSMMFASESERILKEKLGNKLDILDVQGMMESHGLAASMTTLSRCSSGHLNSLEVEIQAQVVLNAMCSNKDGTL